MRLTNIPEKEIERIRKSYEVYNISKPWQNLIEDAMVALNRGEYIFDGSTGDIEWWPTVYEPASLVHDYLWRTGMGGKTSDKIFEQLMVIYRVPAFWRRFRYIGVRTGWFIYFYWIYRKQNRLKPIKEEYKNLINF